jgi:hypothetical protein
MKHHQHIQSRLSNLLVALITVTLMLAFLGQPAGAVAASNSGQPSKRDRELIAQARAEGKSTVTVLIASKRLKNSAVATAIAAAGGSVRVQDNDVDYVRAIVPTNNVDSAGQRDG